MKTNYLLPNSYKKLGWVLLVIGLAAGVFSFVKMYEQDILEVTVFSIYNDSFFGSNDGFFKFIKNDIFDELVAIFIVIGGLLVMFTKEKVEDEFIYKLRKDSLVWAFIFNFVVLVFATIFIYGEPYFHVLVFNMFTPLLFFILRFNFLKRKSLSYDE